MERFRELVHFVRTHSSYYADLYKDVPLECADITAYPIVEQESFWKANENLGEGVLTATHQNGIVFKSGGTTGNPKYSYFTAKEWDDFTAVSGRGFRENGVREGDRIANLFYAGELYASFIYVTDLIKSANIGVTFPISGQTAIEDDIAIINKLRINVLAGVPTTIMNIISYLEQNDVQRPAIDLILFGGEALYPDQRQAIAECFPEARVHSILYASVDGGELGYYDATHCRNGEHRAFDESTIMEIVDEEDGSSITEENKPGKLLVTNLNRRLMPLIRYPVGDRAVWCEAAGAKDRRFRLLGRSEEGARIGPATLYVNDLLSVFDHFRDRVQLLNFQLLITHSEQKDQATIKVVPQQTPENPVELAEEILTYLYRERSMLKTLLAENIIHPLILQWSTPDALESNPRTGKTKHVVDKRLKG